MTEVTGAPAEALVRFPPGEPLLENSPFNLELLAEVDEILASQACPSGRLEIETPQVRLVALIAESRPRLLGLQDSTGYSLIPLHDLALRARQMESARCTLYRTHKSSVMVSAAHFGSRPVLRASTRFVDPAHVLRVIEREHQDAALVFERAGFRTFALLRSGDVERVFFGRPEEDPVEGSPGNRVLLWAFSPEAPEGVVEVFTGLEAKDDPDAGAGFVEIAELARPCPFVTVKVRLAGREINHRVFRPPVMILGRDPGCDVTLDNLGVSRRHAQIRWYRGAFRVEDLGSANGTKVNGERVWRADLALEDRIEVGKFEVTLNELPQATGLPGTIFVPATRERSCWVVGDGAETKIERGLLIGKGEDVDLRARGAFVHQVHARIGAREERGFPVACFGRARLRVNGHKVSQGHLQPGDEMTVGRSVFEIVEKKSDA